MSQYIAERILKFVSGPDLADAILGDLAECSQIERKGTLWYWWQTISSVPALILMHVRAAGFLTMVLQGAFLISILFCIMIWEIGIAREYSWPIARNILDISPLSAGNTCRAVYIALYTVFVSALTTVVSFIGKRNGQSFYFRKLQSIFIVVVAMLPILYLSVFPLATDGSVLFRVSQLGSVITACVLTQKSPFNRLKTA